MSTGYIPAARCRTGHLGATPGGSPGCAVPLCWAMMCALPPVSGADRK